MMGAYARHLGCRWKFLQEYFGEPAEERCGHCDNDRRAHDNADDARHPFLVAAASATASSVKAR
jgi:ATP-dependent DNA helicase RecQ